MVTRGFEGKQTAPDQSDRIPPGQHLVGDFPVLSAGPTPQISVEDWSFTLKIGPRPVKRMTWAEFGSLPQTKMTRDIHCVTKWSKLNTPRVASLSTISSLMLVSSRQHHMHWRIRMMATRPTCL